MLDGIGGEFNWMGGLHAEVEKNICRTMWTRKPCPYGTTSVFLNSHSSSNQRAVDGATEGFQGFAESGKRMLSARFSFERLQTSPRSAAGTL
jgi:hypothetical protein